MAQWHRAGSWWMLLKLPELQFWDPSNGRMIVCGPKGHGEHGESEVVCQVYGTVGSLQSGRALTALAVTVILLRWGFDKSWGDSSGAE